MAIELKDSKRWINAFLAIMAALFGMVSVSFLEQLGEWFDLEAKIQYFQGVVQITGVILGIMTFVVCQANQKAMNHLNEVYGELVKVVWPDRETVVKLTVGVVIGVSIISSIFVFTDFLFQKLLDLIY